MPDDPVFPLSRHAPEAFGSLHEQILLHWHELEACAQYTLTTWRSVSVERLPATDLAFMLERQRQQLAVQSQSNEVLARMLGRLLLPNWWTRDVEEAVWSWEERALTD